MSKLGSLTAALCCGWMALGTVQAADLRVRVLDRAGKPVPQAVVAVQPARPGGAAPPPPAKPAVMDQIDRQFVPHILAIQAGAAVTFPNSDTVSHQVYSFSPAKRFQLSLYRGHVHPPLVFADPGVVVLGCNIHDSMIGYIYVAPGPHFGQTDANGTAVLKDLPAGAHPVMIWHPRFNEPQAQIEKTAHIGAGAPDTSLDIRLTHDLKPELRSLRNTDEHY